MIDFHSHILPRMDDGSRSVEESIKLLQLLAEQGVKRVAATPHFYANDESVDDFLSRRKRSYEELASAVTSDLPSISLGAEVKYYQGISRMENLASLCIEGTDLLLLEMPFSRWTDYILREIIDLSCRGRMRLVIAHIERYIGFQSSSVKNQLQQHDILMQVNADYFTSRVTKRKALKQLVEHKIHLIGSDCHDLVDRPPKIGDAISQIRKKFGDEFIELFVDFEISLFDHKAEVLF